MLLDYVLGSTRAIGYFQTVAGHCQLTLMIAEVVDLDRAAPGWTGDVGVVGSLLPRAALDPSNAVAMVCGPEVMMRFVLADLQRLGLPEAATWISMERNMHCAVGLCGHCQLGPAFVCRDGPVFRADAVGWMLGIKEV